MTHSGKDDCCAPSRRKLLQAGLVTAAGLAAPAGLALSPRPAQAQIAGVGVAEGTLPGGNAKSFDWRILAGRDMPVPWMLAGGLTADNVAEAVRVTDAPIVDVSSGVEATRGVKSIDKIRGFLKRAHRIG